MDWMNIFLTVETSDSAGSGSLELKWLPVAIVCFLALCLLVFLLIRRKKQINQKNAGQPLNVIRQIRVGKLHGQGARNYQQDSFGVSDPEMLEGSGLLAVVADGIKSAPLLSKPSWMALAIHRDREHWSRCCLLWLNGVFER